MTDGRFTTFRGMKVIAEWPDRLRAAQALTAVQLADGFYERIRYGSEADGWGAGKQPCGDCAAVKGELHVPGCDVERCPRCGGQSISCDCG